MRALASSPDAITRKGLRDRAILGVLCGSGLRASEVCDLRVRDVKPALVFVRCGKFGKQRWVPLASNTAAAIRAYLANHPAGLDERLFRTLAGRPLTRRHLHKLVVSYARPLGLEGPAVHTTRHSAATRWLNRGIGVRSCQVALGHESIATTAIYLGVATDALVAEFRQSLEGAPAKGGAQ
jgi:integrase/recombinase XerD